MSVKIVEFSTTDVEVGRAALNSTFVKDRPPIVYRFPSGRFHLKLRSAIAGDLAGDVFSVSADAASSVSYPMRSFVAGMIVGGGSELSAEGEQVRLARGDVLACPSHLQLAFRWSHVQSVLVRFPEAAAARAAHAHAGIGPGEFRFLSMRPVSDAAARQWRMLVSYVHQALDAPDSLMAHPLARAELISLAAAAAVSVFPNTAMTAGYLHDPGPALPAVLRRAVAYIEANVARAITIDDIATAARVAPRALHLAFRREFDTTPMGYVRRERLDGVRRDLIAEHPDEGATVASIAARWGFAHPARFAAYYRARYGEMPSETLHH